MDRYDVLVIVGVLLIEAGIGLMSVPGALIVAGLALILYSAAADVRSSRRRTLTETTHGTGS